MEVLSIDRVVLAEEALAMSSIKSGVVSPMPTLPASVTVRRSPSLSSLEERRKILPPVLPLAETSRRASGIGSPMPTRPVVCLITNSGSVLSVPIKKSDPDVHALLPSPSPTINLVVRGFRSF